MKMNYAQDYISEASMNALSTHSNDPYQLLTNNASFETLITNHSLEPWNLPMKRRDSSQRGIAGFVSKLYQCLQVPENEQKYARWCKHQGRDMFIIECIPEFTEIVLPRLFKHCKFPSFVRQLNIYGFQRDTDARKSKDSKDKESCRWYHPYFRPGRRDLFHLIRRKATRYTRRRKIKQEKEETTVKTAEEVVEEIIGEEDEEVEEDPETILKMDDDEEDEIVLDSQQPVIQEYNTDDLKPTTQLSEEQQRHMAFRLYQERQRYEKVQDYYTEQLKAAHSKIKEQQLLIQRLEALIKPKAENYMPYYTQPSTMYISPFSFDTENNNWIQNITESIHDIDRECNVNNK
ncbi:hypothetical protein G6F60_011423 [Rhizopus arrhizus]|nr:hypothetical protein G6F32_000260 [Rhizopus arrhizus]KAG1393563.1 hypothetical protein G6F60_011423 [Rhizopus arrhizus]